MLQICWANSWSYTFPCQVGPSLAPLYHNSLSKLIITNYQRLPYPNNGGINLLFQWTVIKKSMINSLTAVTYQEDYVLRTSSSLTFLIFKLMSFFRLNSHISAILLEGGSIFNGQGGISVIYDPAHKHYQIKYILKVWFLFCSFSIKPDWATGTRDRVQLVLNKFIRFINRANSHIFCTHYQIITT